MQLDLDQQVQAILDRRLSPRADQPLAVALSGGGDSTALALIAAAWAKRHGRSLLILTVDHRLQPQSRRWSEACAALAARLGATFVPLAWEGPKPSTGLAAAAREARHALIAQAAKAAGARVILMGHTADDVIESRLMRDEGSTTPEPREWAPSPAWPEGRGLFLLRPLITARRASIRDWLAARGESWIDDPANENLASARARARVSAGAAPTPALGETAPLAMAEGCEFDAAGGLRIPRAILREAEPDAVQAFVAVACVCAGGGTRRPAADRLRRVAEILRGPSAAAATLAGARIEAEAGDVWFLREPGEAQRGGLASLYLTPGKPVIWDGRFEIVVSRPGLTVDRLEGLARRLGREEQKALREFRPRARMGLPAIVENGRFACPPLSPMVGVEIRPLVAERLWAACGLIEREPV